MMGAPTRAVTLPADMTPSKPKCGSDPEGLFVNDLKFFGISVPKFGNTLFFVVSLQRNDRYVC